VIISVLIQRVAVESHRNFSCSYKNDISYAI